MTGTSEERVSRTPLREIYLNWLRTRETNSELVFANIEEPDADDRPIGFDHWVGEGLLDAEEPTSQ